MCERLKISVKRAPRLLLAAILLLGTAALPAQDSQQSGSDEPGGQSRPTVGIALSGGGALGFAHVGVLLELAERGIPVDFVSGTSMGSVVGGLFSAGYSAEELLQLTERVDWSALFSDQPRWRTLPYDERRSRSLYSVNLGFQNERPLLGSGATSGQSILELLDELLSAFAVTGSFDRLPRPLRVVATNLETGEERVFAEGDLKTAIRASLAVPGAFAPVSYENRLYVDGGLVNLLPVDRLAEFQPDTIIAVRLGRLAPASQLTTAPDVVEQTAQILRTSQVMSNLERADIVINPDVSEYNAASFDAALDLVEIGRAAARAAADDLDRLAREVSGSPAAGGDAGPGQEQSLNIREVTFPGDVPSLQTQQRVTSTLEGVTSTAVIRETVYGLYDTGRYESVTYRIDEIDSSDSAAAYRLAVVLSLQESRTSQARVGFSYESDVWSPTAPGLSTHANLLFFDVFVAGLRSSTHLWFDEAISASTQVRYPIVGTTALTGAIYTLTQPVRFFEERRPVSVYDRSATGGRLGMVTVLRNSIELWVDGVGEWRSVGLRSGMPRDVGGVGWYLGADIAGRAETIDALPYPRRGVRTQVGYRIRFAADGSDLYTTLRGLVRAYLPLFRQSAIAFEMTAATDFDSGLPAIDHFALGGIGSFHGLYDNEERGNHLATASVTTRIRVLDLPIFAGDSLFAFLRVEGGVVAASTFGSLVQDLPLLAAVSLGVEAETLIGGASLAIGMTHEGRFAVGVRIGKEMGFPDGLQGAR